MDGTGRISADDGAMAALDKALDIERTTLSAHALGGDIARDVFQNARGISVHIDRSRDELLTPFGKRL